MTSYAALIALTAIVALQGLALWMLARDIRDARGVIDSIGEYLYGTRGEMDPRVPRPLSRGSPITRMMGSLLPPPGPPPDEAPPDFPLSSMPDELAADLEADERETFGASSHITGRAPFSEQDEREAEMEDAHVVSLARKIRQYSGEDC